MPPLTVLYKATVALFDGSCVRAWTELFTDRDVAQAWSEWKYQLVEARRTQTPLPQSLVQDSFMVTQYPIEAVRMIDIEEFNEDIRCVLVDEDKGGDSA